MEHGSLRDDPDAPYIRPFHGSSVWPFGALGVAVLVAGLAGYYYFQQEQEPAQLEAVAPQAATATPAAAQASAEPAIRHPLDVPQPAPESLPTLDNSDSMMRDSLSGLMGRKAFSEMVIADQLVRRIVATVDNLPRPTAPRRVMPVDPAAGAFATSDVSGEKTISPANAARYAVFVRTLESLEVSTLVDSYVKSYPLFQRAYEELGYPGKYFNDRLMQAIDDMLAAPEIDGSIKLVRPKVLYEFADPDLETRSAGQKIMLRIGRDNQARVKAKLLEIRRALIAHGKRSQ